MPHSSKVLRRYFRHGMFPQLMVFEAVALKYVKQAKSGEEASDKSFASWNFKKHDTDSDLENELKS